ncbi:MAG: reverse transcriptase family protein [Verrucomicrobiota bacterium]
MSLQGAPDGVVVLDPQSPSGKNMYDPTDVEVCLQPPCVVTVKDETAWVPFTNFSTDSVRLHAGQRLGNWCSIDRPEFTCALGEGVPDHEPQKVVGWEAVSLDHLDQESKSSIQQILCRYPNVFSTSDFDLGRTNLTKHHIHVAENTRPIRLPVRRAPLPHLQEMHRQIDLMLENRIVRPSESPWNSPIVMVKKKDNSLRLCIDYRRLNQATIRDSFPLPRVDDTLDSLHGCRFFSSLDLAQGFRQVEMSDEDRQKTAFSVPGRGHFEFETMPMGLVNAPGVFQRLMTIALNGLLGNQCFVYLDDILITGKTLEEHLQNLEVVLSRLESAGLKLKPTKCQVLRSKVNFLGHVISSEGVEVDDTKTAAIRHWPVPTCVSELRAFLGLAGYYRKYVRHYAEIARPLFKLTNKGVRFAWSTECQTAFDELRARLCNPPILAYPDLAEESAFIIDCDASDFAVGGVLSQVQDGHERVIAFASQTMTKSERNYCVTQKEMLSLVRMLKLYRPYVMGRRLTVRTDHAALIWLQNYKDPEGRIARWLMVLQDYDFQCVHRPGKSHGNADGLSRRSHGNCPSCPDPSSKTESGVPFVVASARTMGNVPQLVDHQKADQTLSKVREWLREGRTAAPVDEVNRMDEKSAKIALSFSSLSVKDDILGIDVEGEWKRNLPQYRTNSAVIIPVH